MVWGLFVFFYAEPNIEGFNSHMIAKYETVQECNEAAYQSKLAHQLTNQKEYVYVFDTFIKYRCAPIPKQ